MNIRAIFMLALAVVFGGAAAFVARDVLLRRQAPTSVAQQGPAMTTIVVANKSLHFGDTVAPEFVREVQWPSTAIPEGSFTKTGDLFAAEGRRVALREIAQDEPVLKSRVSGFGGRAILSTVISEDKRAVTIRVNDVNGVAGFVLPGDLVDVLLTRQPSGGGNDNQITDVLLQHIKVLGIDQDPSDKTEKPTVARAVTVEVTPEESEKLALGSQVGSLSLALRNAGNMKQAAVPRIRVRDLGPEEPKAPVAASGPSPRKAVYRPQMPSMAVTRGTETTIMEVAPEGGPGGFVAKNDGAAPGTKASAKHPSAAGAKPSSSGAGEAAAKPAPEAGS